MNIVLFRKLIRFSLLHMFVITSRKSYSFHAAVNIPDPLFQNAPQI